MEKPAVRSEKQLRYRLLTAFCCLVFFPAVHLYAAKLTYGELKSLHIVPMTQKVYTRHDCGFVLTVLGVKPDDVQASVPSLPAGVTFKSSKKSDYIDPDGDHGTQIEYWFSFSSPGQITLPPLSVLIGGRTYVLHFESVDVIDDPSTLNPYISVQFMSGVSNENGQPVETVIDGSTGNSVLHAVLGTPVVFTVYLHYAVQVMKFDWDLQKDALFTQLREYEITQGKPRGSGYSSEPIPVAQFEWQSLAAGSFKLPSVRITATSYNGARSDLVMPSCLISVAAPPEAQTNTQTADAGNALFAYAFTEKTQIPSEHKTVLSADYRKIAQLRCAERHSLPFSRTAEKRHQAETEALLQAGPAEPSIPLFKLYLICAAAAAAAAGILLIRRKMTGGILCAAAAFFLLIAVVRQHIALTEEYGVFAGGEVSPIPEKTAASSTEFQGGNRVRIVEKAGNWIYIEYNDTGGWVSKENIFIIE